ncbi:hypothetical protein JCM33374_g3350 [Metschnikowia sp. JCM 33374]|nr:hypothetical protein JCM33374_g3350 [Metschnikowia sp. JCM 33374]
MYSAKIKAEETTESCAITKTSLMNASPSARVPSLGSYKGQDTTINITSDLFRAIQEDGVRSEGHDDTQKQLTTSRPGGVQDLSTGSNPKKYATSALTAVSLSHVDPLVLSPNVIPSQRGVSTPNNDTKVLFGNRKETFSGPGGEEKPDTLDDINPIEIFNWKGGSTTVSYFHTRVPYDRPLFTRYGAATARPVEYSHLKSVEKQIDGYNDNITSTITTTRYTYRTLATPRNSGTVSDKMPKQQKTTKNSENPSIPRGSSAMSPNVPVSQTIQANTQRYTAETPVPVVKLVNSAHSLSFKMSSCFCVSVFIFACLCMV